MATTTTATTESPADAEASPQGSPRVRLNIPNGVHPKVDLEGFQRLCEEPDNRDLRLERNADGGLIVMTPASSDSGERNLELSGQLRNWNKANRLGRAYDSSAGFTLPNSAVLSPDAAWIAHERWNALSPEARLGFARIVPDFVAELLSPSDSLATTRAKMAEYIAQGVRLGWLIDPATRTVEISRPGRDVETLTKPATLSGEDVLPGLTLDLKGILFD